MQNGFKNSLCEMSIRLLHCRFPTTCDHRGHCSCPPPQASSAKEQSRVHTGTQNVSGIPPKAPKERQRVRLRTHIRILQIFWDRDTILNKGRQRERATTHPRIQHRYWDPNTRPNEGRQSVRVSTHPEIQRRCYNPRREI